MREIFKFNWKKYQKETMLKHLIVGSTVTQIHTVVLCKKSRICTENALSDFVIVRGNVLKTQMKKNKQTEKTGKQK